MKNNSSFSHYVASINTDISFSDECILGIPTLVLNKINEEKDYIKYLNKVRRNGYFLIFEAKSNQWFKKWGFINQNDSIDETLNILAFPNKDKKIFQKILMLESAEEQLIEILLYLRYFPVYQDITPFWDKYIDRWVSKENTSPSFFYKDDGYCYFGSRYTNNNFTIQK